MLDFINSCNPNPLDMGATDKCAVEIASERGPAFTGLAVDMLFKYSRIATEINGFVRLLIKRKFIAGDTVCECTCRTVHQ